MPLEVSNEDGTSPGARPLLHGDGKTVMKIVDLRCAVIGRHPIVRILTDEGIVGTGQVESSKPYLKPHVLFYRDLVLGMDPTDVERVMLGIRRLGGFKPWGSAVSAIEMALWDIAGKAAGFRCTSCSAARSATGCGST